MLNIKSITTNIIKPSNTKIGGTVYTVTLKNDFKIGLQIGNTKNGQIWYEPCFGLSDTDIFKLVEKVYLTEKNYIEQQVINKVDEIEFFERQEDDKYGNLN